jgi:hypothetical protein
MYCCRARFTEEERRDTNSGINGSAAAISKRSSEVGPTEGKPGTADATRTSEGDTSEADQSSDDEWMDI